MESDLKGRYFKSNLREFDRASDTAMLIERVKVNWALSDKLSTVPLSPHRLERCDLITNETETRNTSLSFPKTITITQLHWTTEQKRVKAWGLDSLLLCESETQKCSGQMGLYRKIMGWSSSALPKYISHYLLMQMFKLKWKLSLCTMFLE